MKKDVKEILKKIIIIFSPIFTMVMFALPWSVFYCQEYRGYQTREYGSYFNLLNSNLGVFVKVVLYVILVCVIATFSLYVLGLIVKEKEKLFNKIASIVLVSVTGVLLLLSLFKTNSNEFKTWVDFLTLPYGLALVYNIVIAYINNKK